MRDANTVDTGGMYIPRQQMVQQPAGVGYAVMSNGMPMVSYCCYRAESPSFSHELDFN